MGTGDDSASGQRAQAEQAADVTVQEPEASQGETLPKFKAAVMPETETFMAGVTFVDADGVIYAQEVKEGGVLDISKTSISLLQCVFMVGAGGED